MVIGWGSYSFQRYDPGVKLRNFLICLESSPWDTQNVEEKGLTLLVKKRATFTDTQTHDAI
jgi:hypothetical protein